MGDEDEINRLTSLKTDEENTTLTPHPTPILCGVFTVVQAILLLFNRLKNRNASLRERNTASVSIIFISRIKFLCI